MNTATNLFRQQAVKNSVYWNFHNQFEGEADIISSYIVISIAYLKINEINYKSFPIYRGLLSSAIPDKLLVCAINISMF